MVAPSLVMRTSPMSSTSILSRPTGPREVLTMLEMARAAVTLVVRTSWPVSRVPLMNYRERGSDAFAIWLELEHT